VLFRSDDAAEQGAASPAGIVDLLLPINQIAPQIALYLRGPRQSEQLRLRGRFPSRSRTC